MAGAVPKRGGRTDPGTSAEADYLRVAGLVRRGEWGDPWDARAVGRAAAGDPGFPHAHRVLRSGGAEERGAVEGLGPGECQRRLEAEGVVFGADGRARPEFRLTCDLRSSLRLARPGRRPTATGSKPTMAHTPAKMAATRSPCSSGHDTLAPR